MAQYGNAALAISFAYSQCAFPNVYCTKSFTQSSQILRHARVARHRGRQCSTGLPIVANASISSPVECGVEWLTTNGGKVSELLDFSQMDARSRLGVRVSQKKNTVLKGSELAEFPEGTFLTPAIAKTLLEKECAAVTDASLNLRVESLFALWLLAERAKKSSSEYAGLLEALPDMGKLDSPHFWNDEELKLLRGSPIYSKSMKVREDIEEEWNKLNRDLFEPNRTVFTEDDFSFEKYKWGLGIADSRTVPCGSAEERVLAPVLINLRPANGDRKATGRVEMSGGMLFSKKRVVLTVDRDMGAGVEVNVLTDGGLYKSDQLVERGVVVEDGQNKWEVSFQVSRLDRFYDDKMDILEMAGMEESTSFDMLEADNDGIWEAPEDMETFVRLLCLSGEDAFLLEGVFRNEVWDFMGLPVSLENEKAMCELMIGACEDGLEEYERGRKEGVEMETVNKKRRDMAENMVEGEKRILKAARNMYGGRLKSLDQVKYYAERRLKTLDLLRPIEESEIH